MKKKKLKRKFKFLLSIVVLFTFFFLLYNNTDLLKTENNLPVNKSESKKELPKEIWPKTYSFNLLATGDALLHSGVLKAGLKTNGEYNFSHIFSEIKNIVPKYDLAYYNQETVFGGKELGYSNYPTFNSPSEWGDNMIEAGFNLVSLATNHSMDKKEYGALNNIKYWKNQSAAYSSGMYSSEEDRNTPKIAEINGIKYAMLSYTYGTNGIPVPTGKEYLVNVYSDELAKKDIENIKDKVDVIIVAMHWGVEYTHTPTAWQKEKANYLADLGVHIILGNHSHTIQPIEFIDDTLVIYSMGNFISNQMALYSTIGHKGVIGAFVTMDVKKIVNENLKTDISIENIEVDLLFTYLSPERDYKVVPFSKMNEKYLKDYQNVFDKYKTVMENQDVRIIPCS